MNLRPYQSESIEALFNWWSERKGENPVVVLPTASGKTVIFSTLIKRLLASYPTLRILILAHTKELVGQAADKLTNVWPDAPVGIYCAGLGSRDIQQVTSASRDSIRRVINDIEEPFHLVIVDEAHLIAPREESSYRKILDALKEKYPPLAVVGFTATPYRQSSGLIYGEDGSLFSDVAYEAGIRDLMKQGYLCPITAKAVNADAVPDLEGIKTTAGDFNLGQLAEAVEVDGLVMAAVAEWHRAAFMQGRASSCFFAVSIAHAEMISAALLALGVTAPVVTGNTKSETRAEILKQFDRGELPALVNVGCLTTGWDAPRLDCIALMRPTKSLSLFIQMVGRGLRLHDSKADTLLLDFGGNLERFGPLDTAQPPKKRKAEIRTKVCGQCAEVVSMYARKCKCCGFEFEPSPVRVCPECDEENAPGAAVCIGCGHVFVTHEHQASHAAVFSDQVVPDLREYAVQDWGLELATSRRTGAVYVRQWFEHDILNRFTRAIMVGAPGIAGRIARQKLKEIGFVHDEPEAVVQAFHDARYLFSNPRAITVNCASQYRDVVQVHY
ncbi:DEAD/DEAH box helicase family protein [Endozoicomonas acroporae]|uniref:DEAD/DEAH box helicase family protein n=1 Tax=Endozoicomonas acroporae TaxID=1701104 RepID=UPI0013D7992A|nr:DEAD/DEAH box helicase family protein [Endozoicomonas acroporae]